MNYYERHLGDYARDTGHLSALEHGVYTLLLDRYYATESPIEASMAYDYARARTRQERAATDRVLAQFFERDGQCWKHGKVEQEIEKYAKKRERAAASAHARWHSERNANAMRTHSEGNAHQSPVTSNHLLPSWGPPDFVPDRLRMAGVPSAWEPADLVAFIAHYSGKAEPPQGWGNLFVNWMIREHKRKPNGKTRSVSAGRETLAERSERELREAGAIR